MINKAEKILNEVFEYDSFRLIQKTAIENILNKRDTLIIMPTGGGKSLCYQIPALIFEGITIIISPLISLMKDQIEQLKQKNIKALTLNSSLSDEEYGHNINKIRSGEIKLIYLAPETLMRDKTIRLLKSLNVSCITVDEAHCISEWGHDFRPNYREITDLREIFPNAVFVALTATATERVRNDIREILNIKKKNEFVSSFNRENLFLRAVEKNNPNKQLLEFLKSFKRDSSGIVYCYSRKQVESVNLLLNKHGYHSRAYHAGLTAMQRKENQEKFLNGKIMIMVATIAFGMGINKPNIRFVVHYDLPKNIESYYQEIGRAGRDGQRADCLLLYGYGDIKKNEYFIAEKEGKEKIIAIEHLNEIWKFANSINCRRKYILGYFGEEYLGDNCGMCDNCAVEVETNDDLSVYTELFMTCILSTGNMFGTNHIIDILRGSKSQKIKKFAHDRLDVYSQGKILSKYQWTDISRQLIKSGWMFKDSEYGSLKLTQKGTSALLKKQAFLGVFPTESKSKDSDKKKSIKKTSVYSDLSENSHEANKGVKKRIKSARHIIIGNKFNNGIDIEELSELFKIKEETVLSNLYKYIQDGFLINPDSIIKYSNLDENTQEEIINHFKNLGTEYLAPIYEKMNGRVNYREIKIMRLFFLNIN